MPPRGVSGRSGAVCSALVTAAVAVGADIASRPDWTHTLAVGALAVLVILGRIVAGDLYHRRVYSAITAAFLIQPVLHAASMLLPAHSAEHLWLALAPLAVSIVVVAATVAAPVTYQHFSRRAGLAVSRLRTLRPLRGQGLEQLLSRAAPAALGPTATVSAGGVAVIASAPRRGPPVAPVSI